MEGLPISKTGREYIIEWREKDAVLSGDFVITVSFSDNPEISETHTVSLLSHFFTMQPLPSGVQLGTPVSVKVENTFSFPYFTLDWGDGAVIENTTAGLVTHEYAAEGTYVIAATLTMGEETHVVSRTIMVHEQYAPPLKFKHIYKSTEQQTITAVAWNSNEYNAASETRTPVGAGVPVIEIIAPENWGSEILMPLAVETNDGSTFDIDFGDGTVLLGMESGDLTHLYTVWQSVRKQRLLYRIKNLEALQDYDVRCRTEIGNYATEYHTEYATTVDHYVPTTFIAYLQVNDFPNTRQDYPYNIDIDWGDGSSIERHQSVEQQVPQYSHTYTLTQDVSANVTVTTVCDTAEASQIITAFWCPDYWYAVPFDIETNDPNLELAGIFNVENTEITDEFAIFDLRFDIASNQPFYHYETTYVGVNLLEISYGLLPQDPAFVEVTLPPIPDPYAMMQSRMLNAAINDREADNNGKVEIGEFDGIFNANLPVNFL